MNAETVKDSKEHETAGDERSERSERSDERSERSDRSSQGVQSDERSERSDEKYDESVKNEETIVSLLLEDHNVFLTGGGGTGKSYTLQNVYLKLQGLGKTVYKTGSTGVAAERIGGMTLHSWAGIMLGDKEAMTYYITMRERNRKAYRRWRNTDILLIDEISMTGAKLFDMLNQLGQLIRASREPFGGLKLLICGDVCQLPPVKDEYFFKSAVYPQLDFQVVRLIHPWRFQKDIEFFYLLSRVRLGQQTPQDIQMLETRKVAYFRDIYNKKLKDGEIKPTLLFSKKVDVAYMNLAELAKIPHEEFKYVCTDTISKKVNGAPGTLKNYQDLMDKNVPPEVSLKKNAQVMLTWNLDVESGLCNGSRGVVIECCDDSVLVRFKNGKEISVMPNVWTYEDDDNIFARSQIPLILAYAITIHKSQSATLDSVIVDLGTSIFSPNMGYVALSRCRSLEGVYLNNLMPEKLYCDPEAQEFEESLLRVK